MNDNDRYPDWGAFGAATEKDAPEQIPNVVSSVGGNAWEMKIKVGKVEIETCPTDTPEQIKAAMQKADELDTSQAKINRERLRLVKSDHPLKGFIEDAMARAEVTSFDEVGPVWRELVATTVMGDVPNHVLNYVASRHAIKYYGTKYDKSGEHDFFTRDALAQLFRRQKANASQRQPTPTDGA